MWVAGQVKETLVEEGGGDRGGKEEEEEEEEVASRLRVHPCGSAQTIMSTALSSSSSSFSPPDLLWLDLPFRDYYSPLLPPTHPPTHFTSLPQIDAFLSSLLATYPPSTLLLVALQGDLYPVFDLMVSFSPTHPPTYPFINSTHPPTHPPTHLPPSIGNQATLSVGQALGRRGATAHCRHTASNLGRGGREVIDCTCGGCVEWGGVVGGQTGVKKAHTHAGKCVFKRRGKNEPSKEDLWALFALFASIQIHTCKVFSKPNQVYVSFYMLTHRATTFLIVLSSASSTFSTTLAAVSVTFACTARPSCTAATALSSPCDSR